MSKPRLGNEYPVRRNTRCKLRRLLVTERIDFSSSTLEMPYENKTNTANEEARTEA